MNRIGGLTPKKIPPSDVGEDDDNEEEKIKSK
jgi:hypothetical protein